LQTQFLAWLEDKLNKGYDITEWEAGNRQKEFRRKQQNFMALAYPTISATGANGAIPHYSPGKNTAKMIDRTSPYIK
jgi:Xaa-Pro aminopeptidase